MKKIRSKVKVKAASVRPVQLAEDDRTRLTAMYQKDMAAANQLIQIERRRADAAFEDRDRLKDRLAALESEVRRTVEQDFSTRRPEHFSRFGRLRRLVGMDGDRPTST